VEIEYFTIVIIFAYRPMVALGTYSKYETEKMISHHDSRYLAFSFYYCDSK